MINKKMKFIVGFLLVAICGIIYLGFNAKTARADGNTKTITISGSSALLPLMEETVNKFNKINPGDIVNVQAGGSGTGLTQVLDGTVDIGNSDMFAEEKLSKAEADKLVDHKVVGEGFCLIASKGTGVDSLTTKQIREIFSGKITNWKQVGGKDENILVIHRPSSSGTRNTFTNTLLGGDKELENDGIGAVQDSNGAVLHAMERNSGAISYMALTYMNNKEAKDSLEIIKINGVSPTVKNIEDGKYTFWSWGHMYTKGKAEGLSKQFIDFVSSKENAADVEKLGFIPVQNIKVEPIE